MQGSIVVERTPDVQYLLRIGDSCLILGQRLSEWCGHAPALEEDIAMANMALDLIGQARALLSHAGQREGKGHDEDQIAFLRDERDYLNVTLVELPNEAGGKRDFAFTVLRNAMMATFLKSLWQRLVGSSDVELAAIAGKAVKEARYHQQHAGEWVVRLADGTAESRRRIEAALERAWPYVAELFESDDVDAAAETTALGPAWASLREPWTAEMRALFDEAGLAMPGQGPKPSSFLSTGKKGRHSEHMGFILSQMQYLQRSYPGGVW